MEYLCFPFFSKVVVSRYREFDQKELNEFDCVFSIDKLFHCLKVDGKKEYYMYIYIYIVQACSFSDVSEILCIY